MSTPVLNLFRLDGKVALVTGGAGIVGRHLVRALAEAGAVVVVVSRSAERAAAVAGEFCREGYQAMGEVCDLASEKEVRDLRSRLLARYTRLDVLFNNAVSRAGGDLDDTTALDWEDSMRLNSTGLFLACRTLSELMRTQRSGSIVNIASIYGMVGPDFSIYRGTPMHNSAAYAFAKGGMINFTRYLASYLAPYGVRVNCISPGGFRTAKTPAQFAQNYGARTPLGRMAEEDDIRGVAVFLASDAARYITGQNIVVDGGWTAI